MTTKKEIIVTIRKHGKKIEQTNAAAIAQVDPAEFDTAAATNKTLNTMLCMNLLAGNVPRSIKAAAKEDGKLRELMPNASNADLNAIRFLLKDKTPAQLRDAWQRHVDAAQRIHGVNLQGIAKELKPKKEKKPSKGDRFLQVWTDLHQTNRELATSKALRPMYDLATELGWKDPDQVEH